MRILVLLMLVLALCSCQRRYEVPEKDWTSKDMYLKKEIVAGGTNVQVFVVDGVEYLVVGRGGVIRHVHGGEKVEH